MVIEKLKIATDTQKKCEHETKETSEKLKSVTTENETLKQSSTELKRQVESLQTSLEDEKLAHESLLQEISSSLNREGLLELDHARTLEQLNQSEMTHRKFLSDSKLEIDNLTLLNTELQDQVNVLKKENGEVGSY